MMTYYYCDYYLIIIERVVGMVEKDLTIKAAGIHSLPHLVALLFSFQWTWKAAD